MQANEDAIKDQLNSLIGEYKTKLEGNLKDGEGNSLNLQDADGNNILLEDSNGNDLTLSDKIIIIGGVEYENISDIGDDAMNEIIQKYNDVVKSYSTIDRSYDVAIQNQNTLANIINTEKSRLAEKKELVDTSIFEQKRAQSLNESYRQKYNYYIYMLVAVILMFVSFIVINQVSNVITFIPSVVYDLLYIISISVTGFFVYFTLIDIGRRDHMDFSKINVKPPKRLSKDELEKQRDNNYGAGVDLMPNFCVGSDCCNESTTWNVETGLCEYNQDSTDTVGETFKMQYSHSYTPIKMKNESVNSKQYESFNTIDNYEYV